MSEKKERRGGRPSLGLKKMMTERGLAGMREFIQKEKEQPKRRGRKPKDYGEALPHIVRDDGNPPMVKARFPRSGNFSHDDPSDNFVPHIPGVHD